MMASTPGTPGNGHHYPTPRSPMARSPTNREKVQIAQLQNGRIVKKKMTYRNPLRRTNKPSVTPPALSTKNSSNHSDTDLHESEVDHIDFKSFLLEPNIDLNSSKGPPAASEQMTFGSTLDLDFEGLKLGDLGDVRSIFDDLKVDMENIKKISPKPPPKPAPAPAPAVKSASIPASIAPAAGAPIPNGAPIPTGAPIPKGAPIPTGAPIPNSAPMPIEAPIPSLAPIPISVGRPSPTATPLVVSATSPAAPMATASPIAPSPATAAPIAPRASQVVLSESEKLNIANAKSHFQSSSSTSNAPTLSDGGHHVDGFVRPEDYDKTADIAFNPDSLSHATLNDKQSLQRTGTVSKFGGLKSTKDVISTSKQEEEYLSKHAKGKVTQFSGLNTKSTRNIITADTEEQKRVAESKVVKKQRSRYMNAGRESEMVKRTSIQIDQSVTEAASAAKNKFKMMEKQNTMQDVNRKKSTAKRRKTVKKKKPIKE